MQDFLRVPIEAQKVPTPPDFYVAATFGLLAWIKEKRPKNHDAFFSYLTAISRNWTKLAERAPESSWQGRIGFIAGLISLGPPAQMKLGTRCEPLCILADYHLAIEELQSFPRRVRNPAHQRLWLREQVPLILKKIKGTIISCNCKQRVDPPPDRLLDSWAKLTKAQIATSIVAYYHGKSSKTAHRLLSEAVRHLGKIRQEWVLKKGGS